MHIAIDTTPLETGHAFRGVGSYTRLLVDSLKRYEKKHSYSLFTRGQKIPVNADLVHYPYFDPFFLTLPFAKPKPTVVTVHDLIPLVFPDKFPTGFRGAIKWQIQKQSLHGAQRILTDSNSSKNDITRIAGIKKEIIDTVYLAPDPEYHPVGDPAALDDVRKKFSLPKQFILYVGDVNWNKNISGLIRACGEIRKDVKLVLVGTAFTNTALTETKEINSLIASLGLGASVIRTGHVSWESLAALYSLASCMVLPSFYEGFGLPVLEGMACGCPVVCTNTSSLKEIAGPALRVSPKDEDIAAGIVQMIHADRQKQVRLQLDWVKQFNWKKTARETVLAYERALE
jgi:glycosyltransferase involved in cell wall biosynthesis